MITILIVEDEIVIQEYLQKLILTIDCEIEIIKTQSAMEALKISRLNKIDIFLLDIQLTDYSGLDLAMQIRDMHDYKMTPMVFLTGMASLELRAFKNAHCYDYILKPFKEEVVINTINTIINHGIFRDDNIPTIRLKSKEDIFVYRQDDIIYFEIKNKVLIVKTIDGSHEFTQYTLKSIMEELDDNFLRCHKGYIVNESYIHHVDRTNNLLYLVGSKEPVPYGRKLRKYFKEDFSLN